MSIVSACRFMGIGSNVPHPRTLFSRRTRQRKARRKVRVGGMDIGILSCVCCRCRIFIKEKEVSQKACSRFSISHPLPLTRVPLTIAPPRSSFLQINRVFSLENRTMTGVVLLWTTGGLCHQSRRLAFFFLRACGSGQSMRKIERCAIFAIHVSSCKLLNTSLLSTSVPLDIVRSLACTVH